MQAETLVVGFISGLISGILLLAGAFFLLLPRVFSMLDRESTKDMSHYGREVGKHHIGNLLKVIHLR